MKYVIFYCILFWDAAPKQPNGEYRQYLYKKECYETKAENKKELKKKLKIIKKKNFELVKIDSIYIK